MAMIYIDGIKDPVTVQDAPDFETAVAMISALEEGSMVVFPTLESDISVAKNRLIMFVQGKAKATRKQFVMPTVQGYRQDDGEITRELKQAKKGNGRRKRARPTGVQEKDSE